MGYRGHVKEQASERRQQDQDEWGQDFQQLDQEIRAL